MLDSKLLTFLAVVETQSYTAAADRLHLTQPAVSQHIKKLEAAYGCRLIDFAGRALTLTEEGRLLYRYARLQRANEALLLERLRRTERPLRLGATLSIADYYLPALLVPYAARPFSLTVGNTEVLTERLLGGALDCAFIEGMFDPALFASHVFRRARFLPVAAAGHPLAGRTVPLDALHDFPLILRERGSGTRAILESYLTQQNDSPRAFARTIEIGSFLMIKQLLAASNGVSFMYEAVAAREVAEGRLCFLQIEDYAVTHPLHFVYLKNSVAASEYERFYSASVLAYQKRQSV